jgi:hypothetical protein
MNWMKFLPTVETLTIILFTLLTIEACIQISNIYDSFKLSKFEVNPTDEVLPKKMLNSM